MAVQPPPRPPPLPRLLHSRGQSPRPPRPPPPQPSRREGYTKQCFGSRSGQIRIIWPDPDPDPDPDPETLIWIRVPKKIN